MPAAVVIVNARADLLNRSSDGAGMAAEAAVATTSMSWAPPSSSKRYSASSASLMTQAGPLVTTTATASVSLVS